MSRVLVLGGGPTGLYAALLLARRGLPVTLVEKEQRPGGLAAGLVIGGQRVDQGSHRLHPSIEPPILADLRRLLGSELESRSRRGRIRIVDRWLAFPFSPSDALRGLPPSLLVRLALGAGAAGFRRARTGSFAEVVATGLGRPMGEVFYYPYARKIWGTAPEQVAGEQARRRIAADSPSRVVRKALSRSGPGRSFLYPTGGFGRIAEALASAAAEAGADLRLGMTVTAIHPGNGTWTIETSDGALSGDMVLSTLPITLLARLLDPPPRVEQAASRLRYRSMVLTYLVTPYPRWTGFDAHYLPGPEVPFTRVSEPKNYRDSTADPPGSSVICVETPCDPDDETWSASGEDLVDVARGGLVGLGLPDPGDQGEVRRIRHAYPVYLHGWDTAIGEVESWLAGLDRLVTLGRQGLFAHDNTHHALAMAAAAVNSIGDDLTLDRARWDTARRGFAKNVVED